MNQENLSKEYKGYSIRLEPRNEYCSNYGFVVFSPEGKEIKHVSRGGEDVQKAFANAEKMIEFELAYQSQ